jgi:hypothetical protein
VSASASERSAVEYAALLNRRADQYGPPPRPRDLPVSKPTRVVFEVVRTVASCISALGVLAVLLHVYGLS